MKLNIQSFGQIKEASVEFGDLTFLIGPQASGKSIFLQLLKLLIDKPAIRHTAEKYGCVWKKRDDILDLYFGSNMSAIWNEKSSIVFNGKTFPFNFVMPKQGKIVADEKLFYIPAQRVLTLADGRAKTFMEFDESAPFILRHFSDTIRLLLQNDLKESVFPVKNLLKGIVRNSLDNSVFYKGEIQNTETGSSKKRLLMNINGVNIPFLTWSAGQKEFLPLLLGFYYLCPPSKIPMKNKCKSVVIEEPEMGLHPQAIQSVILQIFDLLWRGYRVIVSTHSPLFLEFAWAFQRLKLVKNGKDGLYELFDLTKNTQTKVLLGNALYKSLRTYYFSRKEDGVSTTDISSLDAFSENKDVAEWGGLSQFKTSDIVSKYAAK